MDFTLNPSQFISLLSLISFQERYLWYSSGILLKGKEKFRELAVSVSPQSKLLTRAISEVSARVQCFDF
jgi:hypothetical protein